MKIKFTENMYPKEQGEHLNVFIKNDENYGQMYVSLKFPVLEETESVEILSASSVLFHGVKALRMELRLKKDQSYILAYVPTPWKRTIGYAGPKEHFPRFEPLLESVEFLGEIEEQAGNATAGEN